MNFYFPITRTIYAAVSSMSRDNSPVDAESLLRALSRRSVDIPDDFFLEDLFTGAKPSKETLAGWLNGVKNGEEKEADAQTKPKTQPKVAPPTKPTLADTHRSVKVTFPPPPEPRAEAPPAGGPEPKRERMKVDAPTKKPVPSSSAPPRGGDENLSPESGEWLGYLADLTKQENPKRAVGPRRPARGSRGRARPSDGRRSKSRSRGVRPASSSSSTRSRPSASSLASIFRSSAQRPSFGSTRCRGCPAHRRSTSRAASSPRTPKHGKTSSAPANKP